MAYDTIWHTYSDSGLQIFIVIWATPTKTTVYSTILLQKQTLYHLAQMTIIIIQYGVMKWTVPRKSLTSWTPSTTPQWASSIQACSQKPGLIIQQHHHEPVRAQKYQKHNLYIKLCVSVLFVMLNIPNNTEPCLWCHMSCLWSIPQSHIIQPYYISAIHRNRNLQWLAKVPCTLVYWHMY